MAYVFDSRMIRSIENNTGLEPMASDPERILRSANPSFRPIFANPDMSRDADEQIETLEQVLESNNEGPPSVSAREPAHSEAQFTSNLLVSARFCATVQLMAQEKAKRKYASRINALTIEAAEEALSNSFRIS